MKSLTILTLLLPLSVIAVKPGNLIFKRQTLSDCSSDPDFPVVCGDNCMPSGASCCNTEGVFCPSGEYCSPDPSGVAGCCDNGQICSGPGGTSTILDGSAPTDATDTATGFSTEATSTAGSNNFGPPLSTDFGAATSTATATGLSNPSETSDSSSGSSGSSGSSQSSVTLVENTSASSLTNPTHSATTGAAVPGFALDSQLYGVMALAAGHLLL